MNIMSDEKLEDLAERFQIAYTKRREEMRAFWDSEVCKRMINDIITKNEMLIDDDFKYVPEAIKQKLGWVDLSDDTVYMFFSVMADIDIGEGATLSVDDDCVFENFSVTKSGLCCKVLIGQGVIYTIYPVAV